MIRTIKVTPVGKYRLERDIERRAIVLIKRAWPEMEHKKMNGFGNMHWPDRLFLFRETVSVFIEFKRPGEQPTPGQFEQIRLLRELGYIVCVCDDPEQAVVFCGAAIENAKANRKKKV